MFARLPRWVLGGGALLAFVAGIVNACGFLGVQHQGITHLTGTTTLLGIAFGERDAAGIVHFTALIGAFMAGCVASGACAFATHYPVNGGDRPACPGVSAAPGWEAVADHALEWGLAHARTDRPWVAGS